MDILTIGICSQECVWYNVRPYFISSGICSKEKFGLASVQTDVGIPSEEEFGQHLFILYVDEITSIPTQESVNIASLSYTISPVALPTEESFSLHLIVHIIIPTGVFTGEQIGEPVLYAHVIQPTGIPSEENFGFEIAVFEKLIEPDGIGSEEKVGNPLLVNHANTASINFRAKKRIYTFVIYKFSE